MRIWIPVALLLDLLLPFVLAYTYKGYSHSKQVMSVLGNTRAPLHIVYNAWLILLGCIIFFAGYGIYLSLKQESIIISRVLFSVMTIYAIGGCILSGIFSVNETKNLETLSSKIHGFGSVIGFMMLTLAPLCIGIYYFKTEQILCMIFSFICFVLTIIFFVLFVMADKPNFQNTWIALEGVWQRLTLLCMYLPIACISLCI